MLEPQFSQMVQTYPNQKELAYQQTVMANAQLTQVNQQLAYENDMIKKENQQIKNALCNPTYELFNGSKGLELRTPINGHTVWFSNFCIRRFIRHPLAREYGEKYLYVLDIFIPSTESNFYLVVKESDLLDRRLINCFRKSQSIALNPKFQIAKQAELLRNYIMSTNGLYNETSDVIQFFAGWNREVYNSYDPGSSNEVAQVFNAPIYKKKLMSLDGINEFRVVKAYSSIFKGIEDIFLKVVLQGFFAYSILLSIFEDVGAKERKILAFPSDKRTLDLVRILFQVFNREDLVSSAIDISEQTRYIKRKLFEAKDEILIFHESDCISTKSTFAKIQCNIECLIKSHVDRIPFVEKIDGIEQEGMSKANIVVLSNQIFCNEKFNEYVCLVDCNRIISDSEWYDHLIKEQDNIGRFIRYFIDFCEKNYEDVKECIQQDYYCYLNECKTDWNSNTKFYVQLLVAYNIIQRYIRKFDIPNTYEVGIAHIQHWIAERESCLNSLADSFVAQMLKCYDEGRVHFIDVTSADGEIKGMLNIYYDDEYIYVSRDEISKHVISKMGAINELKLYAVLEQEKILLPDQSKKFCNCPKVTIRDPDSGKIIRVRKLRLSKEQIFSDDMIYMGEC